MNATVWTCNTGYTSTGTYCDNGNLCCTPTAQAQCAAPGDCSHAQQGSTGWQCILGYSQINGVCDNGAPCCTITITNPTCPVCGTGSVYSYYTSKCVDESTGQYSDPTMQTCTGTQTCTTGYGCNVGNPQPARPLSTCGDINANGTCPTALGGLPTNISALLTTVFSIALSIAGVVALGLIIASGYRLMISQGNPEQVKNAREQLIAAIIGLLFIIFSLVIMQVISANILKIPGFS